MRQAEFNAKREASDSEDGEAFGSWRRRIEAIATSKFGAWLHEQVRWSEYGGRDGRSEIGASDSDLGDEGPGGGGRFGLTTGMGRWGHSHLVAFALHRFAAGFFLIGQLGCWGHTSEHRYAKHRRDGEESCKSAEKLHGDSIFRAARFSKCGGFLVIGRGRDRSGAKIRHSRGCRAPQREPRIFPVQSGANPQGDRNAGIIVRAARVEVGICSR